VILTVLLIAALAAWVWSSDFMQSQTAGDYTDLTDYGDEYRADEELKAAQEEYGKLTDGAKILSRAPLAEEKFIALTFDGMADRGVMDGIAKQLDLFHMTGAFFFEGSNAAQDPKTADNIARDYIVGNYSYVGISHGEKLAPQKLLEELVKTQKVLQVTTGKNSGFFKLANTRYTPEVLKAAKASGLAYAAGQQTLLRPGEIRDVQTARDFVAKLQSGTIVSFRLGIPTDIRFEEGKTDDRPAIDKRPNLELKKWDERKQTTRVSPVETVTLLCEALKEAGFKTVPLTVFVPTAVNSLATEHPPDAGTAEE